MKLIDAIQTLKGRPAEIPDANRDDLPIFYKQMGFKVGAEIGVYKGEFSKKICETGLGLWAIDPWIASDDYKVTKEQEKLDSQFEETKKVLSNFPSATILRKTSMEAIADFSDESLDFVYIDGNHEFKYIAEDLVEWTKKVKQGGVVSGDDYFFARPDKGKQYWHVGYVLKAFTQAYGIDNWYVIGSKNASKGEKRDKWRSWFFIKK